MNPPFKRSLCKLPLIDPPFSMQISMTTFSRSALPCIYTCVVTLYVLLTCNNFFLVASSKCLLNISSMNFVASLLLTQFVDYNAQNKTHFSQNIPCRYCSHMQWLSHLNLLCVHFPKSTIIHRSGFSSHLPIDLISYTNHHTQHACFHSAKTYQRQRAQLGSKSYLNFYGFHFSWAQGLLQDSLFPPHPSTPLLDIVLHSASTTHFL